MRSRDNDLESDDNDECPGEQRLAGTLVAVDPSAPEFNVPHCARCGDPVALNRAYRRPGPFCDSCIDDIFASAQSYGGEIGELASRYNARLLSYVSPEVYLR